MSFTKIARSILENAQKLDHYIETNNLTADAVCQGWSRVLKRQKSSLRFASEVKTKLPLEIHNAREALFNDAHLIQDLTQAPDDFIWEMLSSVSQNRTNIAKECVRSQFVVDQRNGNPIS